MAPAEVGLAMIVRDEAEVIERCLASAAPHITHAVIVDTGSTDDTLEIVGSFFKTGGKGAHIRAKIVSREWRDFGSNRTELLKLAREYVGSGHLLLLDADMTVDGELPAQLEADAYDVRYQDNAAYAQPLLIRADRNWRYIGATHEYLDTSGTQVVPLEGFSVVHHGDGGHRDEKLTRDAQLLGGEIARSMFYLAQTSRDLGDDGAAWALYEQRAAVGGWPEEVYVALLEAGRAAKRLGDWPAAADLFVRAWERRPSRAEALYELAYEFRHRRHYGSAYLYAARGLDVARPDDRLHVEEGVYQWGLRLEFSIAAFYVGDRDGAQRVGMELLGMDDLPEHVRAQVAKNLSYLAPEREESASRAG